MKLYVAFAFLLMTIAVFAQEKRQQFSFGSEEEFDVPVTIPWVIISRLRLLDDGELDRCQKSSEYPELRRKKLSDHFVASKMNVRTQTRRLDFLVIRSNSGCFNGAHAARFWLYSKRKGAPASTYKMIFETVADGLSVSNRFRQHLPNIETFSHTATRGFITDFKYMNGKYRAMSCYSEDLGDENRRKRRIKC